MSLLENIQQDSKGRLSGQIKDMEEGESVEIELQYDNPLKFPVNIPQKGHVADRYLFTGKIDYYGSVEPVGIWVEQYQKSHEYGVPLYMAIGKYKAGDTVKITKGKGRSKTTGFSYFIFNVSRQGDDNITSADVKQGSRPKPNKAKPASRYGDSIPELIQNIAEEEDLELEPGEMDTLVQKATTTLKNPYSPEAIRGFLRREAGIAE